MAISITPRTLATGVDNPSKQISKNAWNVGHQLTATPNSLIGTDEYGDGVEYDIVGIQSFVTLEQFGGDPTGATYSDAAFTAALEAIGVSSGEVTGTGEILLGAGTYKFASKIVFELSQAQRNSFSLRGRGMNVSKMLWPNADGGLSIELKGQENAVQIGGFSMLTGVASGGTALEIVNSGAFGGGDGNVTTIERVYFAGDDKTELHDAAEHYWTDACITTAVSNINYSQVSVAGAAPSGEGNGITFQGDAATSTFAVACNVISSHFYNLEKHFIVGTWQQGINIHQTVFTNGLRAIYQPAGTAFSDMLSVVGCQLDTGADTIVLDGMTHANIIGNLFFCHGSSMSSLIAAGSQYVVFQGNTINGNVGGSPGSTGIYVPSDLADNVSVVTGNIFHNLTIGVFLDTTTNGWNVQANVYKNVTNPVINSGGGANSVGVATS